MLLAVLFTCLVAVLWIGSHRLDDGGKSLQSQAGAGAAQPAAQPASKPASKPSEENIAEKMMGLEPGKAIAEKLGNETAK
jgi:hypothetical protein